MLWLINGIVLMPGSEDLLVSNQALEVSVAGTYKLQIEDANGCFNEDNIDVHLIPLPDISILGDPVCL